MNDEIQVFVNENLGKVRTIMISGEPWFVGKDVATILGYVDTDGAIRGHVESDDRLTRDFDGSGQNREMVIINESGLYSLILSSKLPSAKEFKRWVTSEVLPSIRKHGAYMTEVTIDHIIADPDFGIKLLMELKEEKEKRKRLEEEKKLALPKVEYFDDLVDRNLLTNFRDTAKELEIKERVFIRFLEDYNYIYRDTKNRIKPFAVHVQDGLFEIKDAKSGHSNWAGNQTLITPKGKSTFQLLLPRWLKRQEAIDKNK